MDSVKISLYRCALQDQSIGEHDGNAKVKMVMYGSKREKKVARKSPYMHSTDFHLYSNHGAEKQKTECSDSGC